MGHKNSILQTGMVNISSLICLFASVHTVLGVNRLCHCSGSCKVQKNLQPLWCKCYSSLCLKVLLKAGRTFLTSSDGFSCGHSRLVAPHLLKHGGSAGYWRSDAITLIPGPSGTHCASHSLLYSLTAWPSYLACYFINPPKPIAGRAPSGVPVWPA